MKTISTLFYFLLKKIDPLPKVDLNLICISI